MADYDLRMLQDNAISEIGDLEGSITLNGEWGDFRRQSRIVCDNFILLASASLLSDMKPIMFFQNLHRAAENWRRSLVCAAHHFHVFPSLHYHMPLYAAIIASDKTQLENIKQAMPKKWEKGEGYQDQFHICWLHLLLALNGCKLDEEVEKHLQALQECESEPVRSELFKALLGLDEIPEQDFWSQFDSVLFDYEEMVNKRVLAFTTKISQFAPHRFIWFEGIAWLRLAVNRGFTLPSDGYIFCPDESLATMRDTFFGDWLIVPLPEPLPA